MLQNDFFFLLLFTIQLLLRLRGPLVIDFGLREKMEVSWRKSMEIYEDGENMQGGLHGQKGQKLLITK